MLLPCVMANLIMFFDLDDVDRGYFAESLLLGSLLWFLGIMCLFNLPAMPRLILEIVPLVNVGQGNPGVALRGARSKMFGDLMVQSFVKSRKCKASKTKMKPSYLVLTNLVL